jgi:membrane-associated phospholipid phosphatase
MINKFKLLGNSIVKGFLLLFSETFLLFVLLIIALFAFTMITKIAIVDERTELDDLFFEFILPFINDQNTAVMVFFTSLGNYQFLLTGNILLILYFIFIKKHRWFAVKIPAIALSSLALMLFLKGFFDRPRPLMPLLDPAMGLSFPSGHAMSSVTFYGLLIYISLIYIKNTTFKFVISGLLILLILMIGLSRVYIRVHFVSDVIAGFSIGIIWLFCAIKILNYIELLRNKKRIL